MIQFHVDWLDETLEFMIIFSKDSSHHGDQGTNYGGKTEFPKKINLQNYNHMKTNLCIQ